MQSIRYSCRILVKLEFSRQIFEKSSNIKFHENSLMKAELFHADGERGRERQTDRQTDRQIGRHEQAKNRFSQFCERACKPT
jgi:hypothetical protein